MKTPETIEDLTNTKNFISDQGVEIEKKKKEIDEIMQTYAILDEFNHDMSYTDQQEKWNLFGCPQRLVGIMESQTLVLEKLKEQMIKDMELEQEEFEENIANLEQTILEFEKNKNSGKPVTDEGPEDARRCTVLLHHEPGRQSVLRLPVNGPTGR